MSKNYSRGVACLIIQAEKIVFEVRAAGRDAAGSLDFCSGHIEDREKPITTIRRELHEELGIPPKHSSSIKMLGECKMYLPKRQKEKDWKMTFYYLEIPPDFDFKLQNTEVANIKKVPFNDGITLIKNNLTQFTYNQLAPIIKKAEQIYHQPH